ncbi:hypothetical protein BDV33DRAFT_168048 [Aspergillus novoparasiticus]|uniref:Zn(2)-C6 fungal-type domain-containing protein n=1 Tax=Aspergillus novoparasiticus TaxID=986946 RepID=A0A5N6F0Z6_9EURO|nr:hypothetical protein BDV33DRAFT_168048 [Aspergillus novoparasiticus]
MELAPRNLAGGHRTKKCGTCRDRRVKCDQQEPFCATCKKLGYTCQGYISSLVIVPFKPAGNSAPSKGKNLGKNDTRASTARRTMLVLTSTLAPDPVSVSREYFLLRLVGSGTCSQGSGIPRLLCAFLDRALPVGSLQHKCMKALTVSYHSMTALGIRENPSEEAIKTYSQALTAVRKAIGQDLTTGPDLLMSIMCLCLYENIVVTQPRAWIEHYKAISHLVNSLWQGTLATILSLTNFHGRFRETGQSIIKMEGTEIFCWHSATQ